MVRQKFHQDGYSFQLSDEILGDKDLFHFSEIAQELSLGLTIFIKQVSLSLSYTLSKYNLDFI